MTCRIENGQTFLQSYNAENRLSGIALIEGDCEPLSEPLKTWSFIYDGDGRDLCTPETFFVERGTKVKQIITEGASTSTTYYYAGGGYEVQTDGNTETVRSYYAIAGMIVAMQVGAYGNTPTTWSFFLTDHLGSVVGITDDAGLLTAETRYMPFGEVRTDLDTISTTDFGYTFQRVVVDSGLMDYKARAYDPYLNRWLQPDTILPDFNIPQSLNRYSYVNNSPVCFSDPSGHCPLCVSAAIGAAIGAVVGAAGYGIYVAASGKEFNWK